MPTILPMIKKCSEEISDPEARDMANKTLATIQKLADCDARKAVDAKEVLFQVDLSSVSSWTEDAQKYVQGCADALSKGNQFDSDMWKKTIGEFVSEQGIEVLKTKKHYNNVEWESLKGTVKMT
jgi:hypothetical protein